MLAYDLEDSKVAKDMTAYCDSERVAPGSALLSSVSKRVQLNVEDHVRRNLQFAPTTKGKLIECVYHVKASADMDGSCICCGDLPRVEAPVVFYLDTAPAIPAPEIPSGWNPRVMAEVSAQLACEINTSAPGPLA